MSKYDALFTPMKVGSITLKNRLSMAAMQTRAMHDDGTYTEEGMAYFEGVAKGGAGLIVTHGVMIQSRFDVAHMVELFLDKCDEEFAKKHLEFTDRIHKHGSKVFLQISPGIGRNTFPGMMTNSGICAGNNIPNVWKPEVLHRALTVEEIDFFIEAFGHAAKIAKAGGYDGVEIHGLHEGYLADQFSTSYTNNRMDEYGGSLENRLRFAKRIREAIADACGQDFPVSMRYSVRSFVKGFNKGALPGEDFIDVGRDMAESIKAAKLLEEYGYDMLGTDNGTYDSWWWAHPPVYMPDACNLDDSAEIQKHVSIPVVCAGRMDDPELCLDAVESGKVMGVALGRQWLTDNEFGLKLQKNQPETIRPCISCHEGCLHRAFKGKPISCAINPAATKEVAMAVTKAKTQKSVIIVGGGIAGMEAARVSALRGHKVDLYEKSGQLGGVFIAAAAMTFKNADRRLLTWYCNQMVELGINIHLNTEVSEAFLKEQKADVVYIATGATERSLTLPGCQEPYVITASQALLEPETVEGKTVIVGGGLTGVELAIDLARNGNVPTILEAREKILMVDMAIVNHMQLETEVAYHKMPTFTNARIVSFENNQVTFEDEIGTHIIPADTIILSVGYASTELFSQDFMAQENVYSIGDTDKVGNLMTGIWKAFDIASQV